MTRPARVPRATYRLQLHDGVGLDDAAALVPHLARLGVSDLYLSPILTAPRGATHGYHILDPTRVDPALGGDEGVAVLASALREHGMEVLLDIVPNHLAASPDNPWWRDVLAHGRASRYARHFDVDWDAGDGRVVLPILGKPLDEAVAAGEITVEGDEVAYYDTRLPIAPATRSLVAGADRPEGVRALLDAQHYALDFWRTGTARINYRRFFDITDLVGVRVEDPVVFADRHERILALLRSGVVTGLRVDHVDGLRDPHGYLEMLEEAAREAAGAPVYVVVEKILEGDEPLPASWPVAGTTGYELLSAVNMVQVDPDGLAVLGDAYAAFTGRRETVADMLHAKKLAALTDLFPGEVDGLVRRLGDLLAAVPDAGEPDRADLREALLAITAAFPVYRTYVRGGEVGPEDRANLDHAFAEARRRDPAVDGAALVALERVLGMDVPVGLSEDVRLAWEDVVARWQQLTGPAMAKGFEDTTFYLYTRLVSLNEVGADAEAIDTPLGVDGFHERAARRAAAWPATMSATSTHDTKRGEDVRARLNVLTEMPDVWAETVARWHERLAGDGSAPAPNEEWLAYQTLVGMWPLDAHEEPGVAERLKDYLVKAAREGKEATSWLDPDERHEEGLRVFVDRIFGDEALLGEVRDVVGRIALPGAANSLAQLAVKMLAPGVPDVYQGCEMWDWSLVDPDNRRPVDHARRAAALEEIVAGADDDRGVLVRSLRDTWGDGRVKLYVTWTLLGLRREREALMRDGDYRPLEVTGTHAGRVLAFAREGSDGDWAAVVVPRLAAGLSPGRWPTGDVWEDTSVTLPGAGHVRDVLTGQDVDVAEGAGAAVHVGALLRTLPVAVLTPGG